VFRFRLDIAGEVQMDRGIARFADGVSDYRPIWPVIEDDFYAQEASQFKSEGSEGGEQWQALSADYAGWKEAHFPGKPILQRTGSLEASLTTGSDPNSVKIEERKTLTLGTRVPYAIYHQSVAPRTKLPRRPEIMLTEAFKRGVVAHMHVYLVQIASMSGFRAGLGPLESSRIANAAQGSFSAGSSAPVRMGGRTYHPNAGGR
jgi:phage gpG-like protein